MIGHNKKTTTSSLQWNARSIRGKKEEISIMNLVRDHDIILLTETWLKPEEPSYISNYNIVRKDRQDTNGGGLAIAVKTIISFEVLSDFFEIKGQIDTLAIKINTNQGPIIFATTYVSPLLRIRKNTWKSLLKQPHNGSLLIGGDFNTHHTLWGSHKNSPQGKELAEAIQEAELCLLNNGSPTRISNPQEN